MIPKHPVFEQHWREFTTDHPEMLSHSRYILESDQEEPALNVDIVAFLHFVRWARQKGYGPSNVSGLIPWVRAAYPPVAQEGHEPDDTQA